VSHDEVGDTFRSRQIAEGHQHLIRKLTIQIYIFTEYTGCHIHMSASPQAFRIKQNQRFRVCHQALFIFDDFSDASALQSFYENFHQSVWKFQSLKNTADDPDLE